MDEHFDDIYMIEIGNNDKNIITSKTLNDENVKIKKIFNVLDTEVENLIISVKYAITSNCFFVYLN